MAFFTRLVVVATFVLFVVLFFVRQQWPYLAMPVALLLTWPVLVWQRRIGVGRDPD